jgi:hypothetical protein
VTDAAYDRMCIIAIALGVALIGITVGGSWFGGYWFDDGPRTTHMYLFVPSAISGVIGVLAAFAIVASSIYKEKSLFEKPGYVLDLLSDFCGWGACGVLVAFIMGGGAAQTDIRTNESSGSIPFHWPSFGSYFFSGVGMMVVTFLVLSAVLFFSMRTPSPRQTNRRQLCCA